MTEQDSRILQAITLIAGDKAAEFTYENFRILVVELLRTQHTVDEERGTILDVRDKLSNVESSAKILLKAIHDVETVSYLNQIGPSPFDYIHILIPALEDISRRAVEISKELPEGNGRKRYKVGEFAIDAMRLCAIIILESWKKQHETSPGPNNRKLWEAADLIWSASGGSAFAKKESLERWKRYFVEMSEMNAATTRHEVIRQYLDLPPMRLSNIHTTELGTK